MGDIRTKIEHTANVLVEEAIRIDDTNIDSLFIDRALKEERISKFAINYLEEESLIYVERVWSDFKDERIVILEIEVTADLIKTYLHKSYYEMFEI